jgi:spore germination cell wall hydrolase CwlJ-like protein
MTIASKLGSWQALPVAGALIAATVVGGSAFGANEEANNETAVAQAPVQIEMVPEVAPQKAVEFVSDPVEQPLPEPEPEPVFDASGYSEADLLCLAKIIHHESANQREDVQLAVAAVVLNRVESPRFPNTICAVALQPKQFFNVHSYRPYNDPRWQTSQRLAREAVAGKGRENAPGALFFRTAGYQSSFFRGRPHIARLGGLDFHR